MREQAAAVQRSYDCCLPAPECNVACDGQKGGTSYFDVQVQARGKLLLSHASITAAVCAQQWQPAWGSAALLNCRHWQIHGACTHDT